MGTRLGADIYVLRCRQLVELLSPILSHSTHDLHFRVLDGGAHPQTHLNHVESSFAARRPRRRRRRHDDDEFVAEYKCACVGGTATKREYFSEAYHAHVAGPFPDRRGWAELSPAIATHAADIFTEGKLNSSLFSLSQLQIDA